MSHQPPYRPKYRSLAASMNVHQASAHIVLAQDTLFGVLMVWMMYGEEPKSFPDLSLLICTQSILFGKLRGAFRCRTALCWRSAAFWRLSHYQHDVAQHFAVIHEHTMVVLTVRFDLACDRQRWCSRSMTHARGPTPRMALRK